MSLSIQNFSIAVAGEGKPYVCTSRTALVFLVVTFLTSSRFIFQVRGSTSQNTGFASDLTIAERQEIIVKDGTITSSPFFKFKLFNAISSATVPFDKAIANFLSKYSANLFSNNCTLLLVPEISFFLLLKTEIWF